ncbi:DUF1697 domain-containing protein [Streptomyces sp. NPDC057654]|uniref:DUF1697 domain-containing protein n=1 Tax=Streptomyces sp. NPDC057654 TaxID=3346196 RepID=UPI0036B82DBD
MTTYVGLLRGINVGKHKRVPMATLRELLTGMGCGSVRTHLNSGNAVFTHPTASGADGEQRLAAELEATIAGELGFAVPCVVREGGDLRRVIDDNPFDMTGLDPSRFLVTFLAGPLDAARLEGLDPAAYAPEEFAAGKREVYCHFPDGVHKAKLPPLLNDRRFGMTATARNWNTVLRLAELAAT